MSLYSDSHTALDAVLRCIDPSNISAVDLEPAIALLQSEGEQGSDRLAPVLQALLDSRAEGIIYALEVAECLQHTPKLKSVLLRIYEATPLRRGPRGRFPPEMEGNGSIGWADRTHAKVTTLVKRALAQPEGRTV